MENMLEKMPRDRIYSDGVQKLADWELISVILGVGVKGKSVFELSKDLALYLKNCKKMPELEALCNLSGLGRAKSCQILACLELSNRFLLQGGAISVTSPADLVPQLAFLKFHEQENMVCISLNGANQVIRVHVLTIGLVNQTQIHAREAFHMAIKDFAVSVIFAHNHPSGSLNPSKQDVETTKKLVAAGALLDIPVLDHLIVSREGYMSIKSTHPFVFA